jgi:hypothetical protein
VLSVDSRRIQRSLCWLSLETPIALLPCSSRTHQLASNVLLISLAPATPILYAALPILHVHPRNPPISNSYQTRSLTIRSPLLRVSLRATASSLLLQSASHASSQAPSSPCTVLIRISRCRIVSPPAIASFLRIRRLLLRRHQGTEVYLRQRLFIF